MHGFLFHPQLIIDDSHFIKYQKRVIVRSINRTIKSLCSFNVNSTANNQGLAAVWKNRCGSDKTIAELFSYVVNSGSTLKCYTVKRNSEYWNEVNISGTTIIYDIITQTTIYHLSF